MLSISQGRILEAQIHPKCSYARRSILQDRGVIEKGAIWRVGDGQKIDVWLHHWLHDLTHSKICSPRANLRVEMVCDLFHTNTRAWDPGKLESCFLPWEAEMVSRIQVSEVRVRTGYLALHKVDGEYSVRSAYRQLVADDPHGMPSSSSPGNSRKFWKKIWNNKVRHFLWRAVKDSLLTKQNLKARHVPMDDTCDH